ncbi:uncharacterized protein MELLADRAFT_114731 [Melampsora larici-populina 98AG31]|uniref:Uncharacterized protein n=1 Tax=Melampsora larici-populina (strain 98AG31 / pathotype 3-4-7) TaxID=747676 RepID=F4SEJ6_MELLP|nr:uncharacterized protein MELLADRAFT_114731 [Melampsora larici-populina 98AG31]EGF96931.1 hypothetical protein MELLADRAFT_114731 [Melampsora larici-populina 98AG31]
METGTSMTVDPSSAATSESVVTPDTISAAIAQALKQQATEFQTIIGTLQTQVSKLSVKKGTQSTQSSSTPMSQRISTPPTRKVSQGTTPPSRTPRTPATPTPPRKKHPLQLHLTETPKDFKSCKMMWGLYRQSDIPPTPNPGLLQEFNAKFSTSAEVEAVIGDPASGDIIARESILSLKELRVNGGKIARGLGHIDQISVLYMNGILAKVGIREWAPDLEDAPDSLYNSASSGTYNYMNVELKYADNITLFIATYNHYVHYVMAGKYKAEKAEAGRLARESNRKNIQKYRERLLSDERFTAKYRDALSEAYELSDEEDNVDPGPNEADDEDDDKDINMGGNGTALGTDDDNDQFYEQGEYGNLYDDE